MSQKSSITTRSQTRRMATQEERADVTITDSGMQSERVLGSPSVVPTISSTPVPLIPLAGGRVIDHRGSTIQVQAAARDETGGRISSAASRASTRCSRKSAEYLRKRAAYEAERELVRLKEQLVQKKLEADLAEIDAAEEESDGDSRSNGSDNRTTQRVAEWVSTTPLNATSLSAPVMSGNWEVMEQTQRDKNVSTTQHNMNKCVISESDKNAPLSGSHVQVTYTTAPIASVMSTSAREGVHSRPPDDHVGRAPPVATEERHRNSGGVVRGGLSGRHSDEVDQLADAIRQLARPRPVPRQAYELPHFTGDPVEWLSFKNMYWETAKLYEFQPHENIARLKTSLQGDAKIVVEDLLRTSTDPCEIIEALEEEYGHPTLILKCAISKIRELPRVSESGREFRLLSNTVRNCVSLLRNIKAEGYINNPQLVDELLHKLTPTQQAQYGEYAMKSDQTYGTNLRISPSLQVLSEYLAHQARIASYYNQMESNPHPSKPVTKRHGTIARNVYAPATRPITHRVHTQVETTSEIEKCALCESNHTLVKCERFLKEDSDKRWELVKQHRLCFKCLLSKHSKKHCKAARSSKCNYSHHLLLHTERKKDSNTERVTNICGRHTSALLKVLPVEISSGADECIKCYALLDDGATVSLIDSELAKNMAGPTVPLTLRTARGLCVSDEHSRVVAVTITGPNGDQQNIKCRTINNLNLPPQTVGASVIRDSAHLRDLGCAEMRDAKPLLLLGQDNWDLLVGREIRRGKSGKPVASLTKLGWVVHGPCVSGNSDSINCMAVSLPDLHGLVKSQFELEAIGITQQLRQHAEVKRAVEVLDNTSCRVDGGQRWQVGLLWKQEHTQLPDNYSQALQRLEGIERRMRRDPAFAEAYTRQIDRLLAEGYARKLKPSEVKKDGVAVWYLPHFGVVNPNKPGKLRLVFDAAASFKGSSLNDKLLTGPDLLNSLIGVLLKFRIGPVAFAGDIADMFLRVKVRPEDQHAQRFLWRDPTRSGEPPDVYVMTSMIFGAVSSPTSAIYVLNRNASEYEGTYPRAVEAVKSKHYMDDYLDSAWTVEEAYEQIKHVTQIHASGGFNIRGWVTNSAELRKELKVQMPERMALEKEECSEERTLGMIWAPGRDSLAFDLSFKRLPEEIVSGKVVPTKRQFLSFIMSVFDPLGFLYPCIIQSRVLMQRVWGTGIQWDEPLREKETHMWFEWLESLQSLQEFAIPRWYGIDVSAGNLELHVFGDASELAYAAVAYLVGTNAAGERKVAMLMGKARVAPQKVISIPRLELQAAVLASRLGETVERELGVTLIRKVYWTDSMTVLKWVNSEAYEFQKFVSHRLAEIDRLTERGSWRWVPSAENPADRATRLDWPLNCKEWCTGPLFLRFPEEQWPALRGPEVPAAAETESPEVARERIQRVHVAGFAHTPLLDHTRLSTWTLTVRTLARALAFTNRCRRRRETTQLCAQDLRDAEHLLLQEMQEDSFTDELRDLRAARPIAKGSKLRGLDPMLTDDGLLRVRGRLGACEELSFGARHPIILDGRHPLTLKLVGTHHVAALHANHETVVNNLREKYWILHLRATVRKAVSACQACRVRRAQPAQPKMADLPTARLTSTRRAFVHVGLDYFGPMEVTIGRRREKRWGALFTCLATRAVHLELAASLTTDSAILALRRLIARRGRPAHLYSDRGTNFVGADNELRAALRTLDQHRLREDATARGIEWHFNPPAAPHMGGCWERLVRSVKTALRATLRERAPREEVLQTLLAEAELVINSRPLCYVPSDSEHPMVLTPNHLLIGTASGDTPFTDRRDRDVDARSQWRRVNALADMFWRRWLREYLPTLQVRQKWTSGTSSVREGDVVAVVDDARPRNEWTKGIVTRVYFGKDNVIRVIDIRTRHGVLRRPVVRVVVLPTDPEV